MTPILLLLLALADVAIEPPWPELTMTIAPDYGTSSDTATLCRVTVVNSGNHLWPGRQIRFEAVALEGDTVMERVRGRFGLLLEPHETLETLIGFSGHYSRFAVRPLFKGERTDRGRHGKGKGAKRGQKRPH